MPALLPVYSRLKPASMAGVTNGQLPATMLVSVPMGGGRRADVQADYARALRALQHDLHAATGIELTHVGDYRSYPEQVSLLKQRYVRAPTGTRFWDGSWWRKVSGATVATPGTSDHGWGIALDGAVWTGAAVIGVAGSKAWPWIRDHLTEYGLCWAWDEMDEEPWHWHLYAIATAAVLAYEYGSVEAPPAPIEPTPVEPAPPVVVTPPAPVPVYRDGVPLPSLAKGSSGPEAAKLISALKFWNWYPAEWKSDTNDGIIGDRGHLGIVAMQKALGLGADGKYGPVSAARYGKHLDTMAALATWVCPIPLPPTAGWVMGAQGEAVKRMQEIISWWGVILYKGVGLSCDGDFGNATKGAVIAWQSYLVSVNRLPNGGADGNFGRQTHAASCGLLQDISHL